MVLHPADEGQKPETAVQGLHLSFGTVHLIVYNYNYVDVCWTVVPCTCVASHCVQTIITSLFGAHVHCLYWLYTCMSRIPSTQYSTIYTAGSKVQLEQINALCSTYLSVLKG